MPARQYTSYAFTQVLDDHQVLASIGSVGDAYDNAMAESFVDSFKTELITDRVWRTRSQLELAIVEYVSWFNHERLHESLGDIPPAEMEALSRPVRSNHTLSSMRGNHSIQSPRDPARLSRHAAAGGEAALCGHTASGAHGRDDRRDVGVAGNARRGGERDQRHRCERGEDELVHVSASKFGVVVCGSGRPLPRIARAADPWSASLTLAGVPSVVAFGLTPGGVGVAIFPGASGLSRFHADGGFGSVQATVPGHLNGARMALFGRSRCRHRCRP